MKYQVAIVEDDVRQQKELKNSLLEFPEFLLVGTAGNIDEAEQLLRNTTVHLVFLDVELPPKTCFDLLRRLEQTSFKVIFTTAYDKYAVQAFRISAIDYLLKPIVMADLVEALQKFKNNWQANEHNKNIQNLIANHFDSVANQYRSIANQRIALPSLTGFSYLPIKEIVRCESDNTYTTFHLIDKRKIVISRTLKEVEEMLIDSSFYRVHNSHLINLDHFQEYIKGEGGLVKMSDGSQVDVSRRRKEDFLLHLKKR